MSAAIDLTSLRKLVSHIRQQVDNVHPRSAKHTTTIPITPLLESLDSFVVQGVGTGRQRGNLAGGTSFSRAMICCDALFSSSAPTRL